MRKGLQFRSKFLARFYREPFTSVDRWFAALRVFVIAGGVAWLFAAPILPYHRSLLIYNFVFFCFYSVFFYLAIFRAPQYIRKIYLMALFLDLIFLFWLIRFTGGFQSDFLLALILLIALHSFYFGISFGLLVTTLSSAVYLLAGVLAHAPISLLQLILRLIFFLLVWLSMGLLSRKEHSDRLRIEKLNRELHRQHLELEREKEKLSYIIEGIDAALLLVDQNMCIEWMNSVAEAWFGAFTRLRGLPCSQAVWGDDKFCLKCPGALSFQKGKVEHGEFERNFTCGQRKFYRITSAPIRDEQGNVINVLELIQDITEEKALQAQLVQSGKLAAIGELASGIAHEINNPLSAIAVCVEDLAEIFRNGQTKPDVPPNEILDCIDSIKNQIRRCKRITTGLLNFSRTKEPQLVPIDLNLLIRNTALFARHRAEMAHIQLQFDLSPDLPLVMAEADELAQVFLNILINALDFTPDGKEIRVRTERAGENQVSIQFIDQGYGIPAENLSRIFSPFFTTKPAGKGTGLGLAISRRIVHSHGGRIEVQSKPGKGTTVTILLPINLALGSIAPDAAHSHTPETQP